MEDISPGIKDNIKAIRATLGDWADKNSDIECQWTNVGEADALYSEFYNMLNQVELLALQIAAENERVASVPVSS